MGLLDKVKDMAGKHTEQIDSAGEKAADYVEKLDDK